MARCLKPGEGFTLLELLVTITVVAVLAALIFASINKVRSYASRTSDLGRIRKLAAACITYSIDCGHYPDSFQVAGMTWDLQLFPALGLETGKASPAVGLLDQSAAGLEVFAASWDNAPRKQGGLARGFALAGWICNAIEGTGNNPGPYTSSWGVTWPYFNGAPLVAINRPGSYILLTPVGVGFQSPNNVIGAGSYALSDWPGNDPASWPYSGSAPFAFCDCSVSILRCKDFKSITDFRMKYADNRIR